MVKITDLKQVKELLVDILEYFIKICDENNIDYSLAYGTCLGAVRHRGFIPWDDDIDVVMSRKNYLKLLKVWNNDGRYKLYSNDLDKNYVSPLPKICDTLTYIDENKSKNAPPLGLYVDVFIFDYVSDDFVNNPAMQKRIKQYSIGYCLAIGKLDFKNGFKNSVISCCCKLYGHKRFLRKIQKAIKKYSVPYSKNISVLNFTASNAEIYDSDLIEEFIEAKFERLNAKIIKQYDKYLTKKYGDYMVLPPENKRVAHNYIAYKK